MRCATHTIKMALSASRVSVTKSWILSLRCKVLLLFFDREGDGVIEDNRVASRISPEHAGVGDVIELRADSAAISKFKCKISCRAEIDGEAELFAVAVVVDAGCKTRCEDEALGDEDIYADAATDVKAASGRDEESGQRSYITKVDVPAVFELYEGPRAGFVKVKDAHTCH